MNKNRPLLVSLICTLSVCIGGPAFANGWSFGKPSTPQISSRISFSQVLASAASLGQVLEAINAVEPGSQLDTRTVVENGRTIYVVRWQASRGRIIIFRVDAETGQIIGRQG
jgi:hypothetical protein